jgi:hypothetical protein
MTHRPPTPNQKTNKRAIAWALFSQCMWLPSLFADTKDWISSKQADFDFSGTLQLPHQNLPASIAENPKLKSFTGVLAISQTSKPNTLGIILNQSSTDGFTNLENKRFSSTPQQHIPTAFTPAPQQSIDLSLLPKSIKPYLLQSQNGYTGLRSNDFIKKIFTNADLLGGSLTLDNINEPEMPSIARAEMAKLARSGDPLAVIPSQWRESMRKALSSLKFNSQVEDTHSISTTKGASTVLLEPARIVHVSSQKIKRQIQVPLALQSDGTVDILNQPDDPGVVDEIKSWSNKQQLPAQGRMFPAIVHFHPLVESETNPQSLEKFSQSTRLQPAVGLSKSLTLSEPVEAQTSSGFVKPDIRSPEQTSTAPSESALPEVAPQEVAPSMSSVNVRAQDSPQVEGSSGGSTNVDALSIGGLNP